MWSCEYPNFITRQDAVVTRLTSRDFAPARTTIDAREQRRRQTDAGNTKNKIECRRFRSFEINSMLFRGVSLAEREMKSVFRAHSISNAAPRCARIVVQILSWAAVLTRLSGSQQFRSSCAAVDLCTCLKRSWWLRIVCVIPCFCFVRLEISDFVAFLIAVLIINRLCVIF